MKFAWKVLTDDSLWGSFFRAKYSKSGIVDVSFWGRKCSRFWKSVVECFSEVVANSKWRIKQ